MKMNAEPRLARISARKPRIRIFMQSSGDGSASLADASPAPPGGHGVVRARRRFRPEVVPTLVLLAVLGLTLSAGRWQLDRAAFKVALQHRIEAVAGEPPMRIHPMTTASEVDASAWRPIDAIGHFDARRVVLLDNRLRDGVAGYEVLTPLVIAADGRALLVNRGWVAAPPRRDQLPQVVTPAGEVRVTGLATVPSARFMELRSGTDDAARWQNWTVERARERWGIDLMPFAMLQTAEAVAVNDPSTVRPAADAAPGADGLARVWPRPDVGIDKHRGYALQWFSFALIATVVWLVLSLRRPHEQGRTDVASAS
jgi:surfeit locus 1 family protein